MLLTTRFKSQLSFIKTGKKVAFYSIIDCCFSCNSSFVNQVVAVKINVQKASTFCTISCSLCLLSNLAFTNLEIYNSLYSISGIDVDMKGIWSLFTRRKIATKFICCI